MLIDPFTIIAQIVNFVILAAALKYFLYERVIAAMDEREAKIARRLHDARERESEASAELAEYERRQEQFAADRRALLDEAQAEAAEQRRIQLERNRTDIADQRQRWLRRLEAEQDEFDREIRRHTAVEVVEVSRRVLGDLGRIDVETAVIDRGIEALAETPEARRALSDPDAGGPITVRTSVLLDPDRRDRVTAALRTMGLRDDRPLRFETDPGLILGIEFQTDGTRVGWNAADYLDQLETRLTTAPDELERDGRGS